MDSDSTGDTNPREKSMLFPVSLLEDENKGSRRTRWLITTLNGDLHFNLSCWYLN